MKKRVIGVWALVVLLAIVASMPVLARSSRGIDGLIAFHGPWAGGMDILIDFDVREANPVTHEAAGTVKWRIWHKEWGWRKVDAHAACVRFGEDEEGNSTAILVSRIDRKSGWGQGEPGEYAYWWLRDSPGGDQHSINYYRLDDPTTPEDEWYEFCPRGRPPACEDFEPLEPPVVIGFGDLAIHQ